jgi:hypothetical protein
VQCPLERRPHQNPSRPPELHLPPVSGRLLPSPPAVSSSLSSPSSPLPHVPSNRSPSFQVLVLGTSRHPQAAVLQAVVAISPSNSGRLRRSPPVVSTSSRFPRSPLPIPCLASTLGHLSHRRFEPLESLVRPCSHKPEKARTRERRRSWLFCS